MQEIMLIGNLGQDCIVTEHNDSQIINFSVCSSEKWKDKNGVEQSKSEWFDCSWWLPNANIAPYLLKGTQVFIKGKASAKAYINKDGEASASLNVKISTLQLLGGAKNSEKTVNTSSSIEENNDYAHYEPVDKLPY
jgi:single-strand DNA-binding protein